MMGNFKQVVLGAALLTAAFFVGAHFSGGSSQDADLLTAEMLRNDDLVWNASPPSSPQLEAQGASGGSQALEHPPVECKEPASPSCKQNQLFQKEFMPSFAATTDSPHGLYRSQEGSDPGFNDLRPFSQGNVEYHDEPSFAMPPARSNHGLSATLPKVPAVPGSFGSDRVSAELSPLANRAHRQVQLVIDSFHIHVVRPGESLPSIAIQYYGSPDFYLDIYLANQDVLASPAELAEGVSLKIPIYDARRK